MIWIILIVGLLLRSISLNQSLWLDEAINVLATQKFSFFEMIIEYAKADFHPPLFFIILWIWTKIFGIGEIFVRIPSIIFGLSTIYITYLFGKKILSKGLGLLSALLLAINPLHIYYSQEARMYSLAAFAVALNFLLFFKLIKNEKISLPVLIFTNLLVLFSDYVIYLTFPAQILFLFLHKSKQSFKIWLLGLGGALAIWSIWIPTFLNQLKVGSETTQNLPAWKLVVGGFDIKAMPLTLVKFIIGRISLDDKFLYGIILFPITLLFIFLIVRAIKEFKKENILLVIWLIVPIFFGTLISTVIPIYSYFRMIFTLPSFLILVALGLLSFKNKIRKTLLGFVLFIQIFSTSIYLFNSSYHREDWKGLVNYLKSQENKIVLFESSGNLSPFDYYSKGSIAAMGALKKFPADTEDDIIDLNNIQVNNIFLINYLVDIGDPKRLVKQRLTQLSYRLVETKDFNGVGFVDHYAK